MKITNKEMRALLHWASYGVMRSNSGSYQNIIVPLVKKLSLKYGVKSAWNTEFGKYL